MRPTKYKEAFICDIEVFTSEINVDNFTERCSVDHIAELLGICHDTVYEWKKDKEKQGFSDAIKKWETKRNAVFYRKLKDYPTAIWIFLAKNWLGMSDRQQVELAGSKDSPLDISIHIVE